MECQASETAKITVDGQKPVVHVQPFFPFLALAWSAQIAQLAEHVLGKDGVAGSNPVLGSRSTPAAGPSLNQRTTI
jgi:hypothetical protein